MAAEFARHGEADPVARPVPRPHGPAAPHDPLVAAPGTPPWQPFWALDVGEGEVLGVSVLRHRLDGALAEVCGHIGLRVRPERRRQGIGTRIFGLTLAQARTRGLACALVLCEPDNPASVALIRRHGGEFEREASAAGQSLLRFWVPTAR